MAKEIKLKRKGDEGEFIPGDPRYRKAMANFTGAAHETPPVAPRKPPKTFTAVKLEEDETWEHAGYGMIQGIAGHFKVTDDETGDSVQVHENDLYRLFEAT